MMLLIKFFKIFRSRTCLNIKFNLLNEEDYKNLYQMEALLHLIIYKRYLSEYQGIKLMNLNKNIEET